MTPIDLLTSLKAFCEENTRDLILPVKPCDDGEKSSRAPDVYVMRLPDKKSEVRKVPYILLQLLNGSDAQEEGESPDSACNVRVIVATYSEDAGEGAFQALNVITRLRTAFLKRRVIASRFTLRLPLEYLVYPEDTAPYFMGEMATTWEVPTIKREVSMDG